MASWWKQEEAYYISGILISGRNFSRHQKIKQKIRSNFTAMIQLKNKILKNVITAAIVLITGCSGTKHLPPGEKLYTGAEIKFESADKIERKKFKKAEAESAVRPKPNKTFLGMRPKVWMYTAAGEPKKKGLKSWMKKKGEAPVLLSSVKPAQSSSFIDAKLFNIGIFKGYTQYKVVEKKRTAKIIYTCYIHTPYTIAAIQYPQDNSNLSALMRATAEKTLVKEGDDYNLDILKNERIRIDAILKDNGYFFFNPDYLVFKADTSEVHRTVSLKLGLKEEAPAKALITYTLGKIYVDSEYSLNTETDTSRLDTLMYRNTILLGKDQRIRPKVLLQSIYLRKGELYSRKNHNITLNRLMTMGNYKFVRIRFTESDSAKLNALIMLTPMPKRTVRSEIDLVSKSNDFIGPRANLSYRNRNTFNGAELLNLTMSGSFETQFSGKYKDLYSYSVSPQVELYFPRFIVPFTVRKTSSMYVPKTRLSLGYTFLKRINYFDMRTFQFIYGFKWKEDIRKEHELNPININFTSVANRSAEFNQLLESNPFLKKSYDEQFIAGGSYSFTYNEQMLQGKKEQFYFNAATEISGNTFSIIKAIGGEKFSDEDPAKVAGAVYSQFARISLDGRTYINFNNKTKVAMRVFAGVGQPYGNSSTLPYIKQYFSGGPNSLRAFPINSVGPGTYLQTSEDRTSFLQLGGDIKLETNVEYRFNIIRFFKGAVFADAGNVWLMKENPVLDTDPFSFSRFYNELALGAGVGLRIDVSFFVLRFDVAMPLRKPWLPEGDRWVMDKISFGNPTWRSDNLILNIAIGYPF
jgi:outer membrane protein assembly factor BamA